MAYGIYLKLDQTQWREFDYSSEDKLTGIIYTDKDLTTPKNLSGYTVKLRISKRWHIHDRFGKTADIVIQLARDICHATAFIVLKLNYPKQEHQSAQSLLTLL